MQFTLTALSIFGTSVFTFASVFVGGLRAKARREDQMIAADAMRKMERMNMLDKQQHEAVMANAPKPPPPSVWRLIGCAVADRIRPMPCTRDHCPPGAYGHRYHSPF